MIKFLNPKQSVEKQLKTNFKCHTNKEDDTVYTLASLGAPTLFTDAIPLPSPINDASISLQIYGDSYNARFGFMISNSIKDSTNNKFLPYLLKNQPKRALIQHLNGDLVSNAMYLHEKVFLNMF